MKISSKKCASLEDSPEEGEIFSDELEDISDVSLSLPTHKSGKSHYHSDNLDGLSLSSVSDLEEATLKMKNQRKRKKCFSHRMERQKKHRKKPPDSDSSDDDSLEACRLKLQLKATVQLDSKDVITRNSLKTRLRAMVNNADRDSEASEINLSPNINATPEPSITIIDLMEHDSSSAESIQGNMDNSKSSKDDLDNELIQLRLEALRTAIQNKYSNGAKSRKARNNESSKENISNNCETHSETLGNTPEANSNSEHKSLTSPEEDEDVDVLRALLLASMSRKISAIDCAPPILSNPMPYQKINVISNGIENNRFKRNNNVKAAQENALKPLLTTTVKPLIICVNSDSDSDSEWELSTGSPEKSPKKSENVPEAHAVIPSAEVGSAVNKTETALENTIEQFLKEQRAKVEHLKATEPVPSKTTVETPKRTAVAAVAKPKPKPAAATGVAKTKITAAKNNKVLGKSKMDKSVLSFLPATKREEYRKLQDLLRQKNAQRCKSLAKKLENKAKTEAAQVLPIQTDDKIPESCAIVPKQNTVKNVQTKDAPIKPETKRPIRDQSTQTEELGGVQLSPKTEARLKEFRSQELIAADRNKEKRLQTQRMRNILKQLQVESNGRYCSFVLKRYQIISICNRMSCI